METLENILSERRLISIIRGVSADRIRPVLDAVCRGGVYLAEITYDASGARSDEETAAMIADAVKYMDGKMYIGAGTVLTEEQVELTARAGGRFIISPNRDVGVIRRTKELGLISMPAAMTVSEIVEAHRAGADYIKIFPADAAGGAPFFKAVRGPLPHIRLLAVSGVAPEDVPEYSAAGACGFGIGSGIVNSKLWKEENYNQIEENARRYAAACVKK